MASSGKDGGDDVPIGEVALVAGDEGESHHSREGLVEYIGTIRKEMRRILPCLPDLTMLRLLGGKI